MVGISRSLGLRIFRSLRLCTELHTPSTRSYYENLLVILEDDVQECSLLPGRQRLDPNQIDINSLPHGFNGHLGTIFLQQLPHNIPQIVLVCFTDVLKIHSSQQVVELHSCIKHEAAAAKQIMEIRMYLVSDNNTRTGLAFCRCETICHKWLCQQRWRDIRTLKY